MSKIRAYAKSPDSSALYPLLGTTTAFVLQIIVLAV